MKKLLILLLFLSSLAYGQTVPRTYTATGTNTYAITEAFPATYTINENFYVRFTIGNTTAVTLNRATLGAKAVQKAGAVALVSGDIVANGTYLLNYNGTYYQLVGDGGGGDTITASNGLTKTGNNIALGGAVTSNIAIDPSVGLNFTLSDGIDYFNNLDLVTSSAVSNRFGDLTNGYFNVIASSAVFSMFTVNPKGIQYGSDYSTDYTIRSLTDKGYVLGAKTFTGLQTFRDDYLIMQDNLDLTKQANFQLSGITTGTSTTLTLPNGSGTIARTSDLTGGTVTNVSALTLGTTGTDLSSTVANATTTPAITLNVPTASAANRGALSSTDWSTFNGKQSAITFGTGVQTALGVNVGSAGAFVTNGGALGTPSGGVATNLTGTAAGLTSGNVTNNANLTGAITSVGNASSLGTFTWTNFNSAITGTAPYWSLANGGTLTGANTFTATGTNNVTFNYATLGANTGFRIASTSTDALSNTQKLFEVAQSGANVTTTQTTHSGYFTNTKTGTSATNIAVYGAASGGATNYAGYFDGNVNVTGKAFIGAAPFTPTSTGDLQVRSDQNSATFASIVNNTNGTSASSVLLLSTASGLSPNFQLILTSAAYSTSGILLPSTAVNYTNASGGLNLGTAGSAQTSIWTNNVKRLSVDVSGNIGIGTSTFGTSAASVLAIKNGTAPSTSVADQIQLYAEDVAASSELKVRDEANNITTLSPHNFSLIGNPSEPGAFSHYSEYTNPETGGREAVNIDMLKLARLLETLTGEKLVYKTILKK